MLTFKLTIKMSEYVQLNNWPPPHLTLTKLDGNCYIIVQDFKEHKRRFHVRGIMYTKEVHVRRPCKVAGPRISQIQGDVKILSNLKSFDCQAYGQKAVYILLNFYSTFILFLVHTSLYYKVIARRCISADINFPKVSSWQVVVDQKKSQKLRSCTDDSFQ